MYCRLPYVSRGALPLKTLVLYIYRPRDTMQYNQQFIQSFYSFDSQKSETDNANSIVKKLAVFSIAGGQSSMEY
jgi:hypothetical protein